MTVVLISKTEDEHLPYITKHLPKNEYVVIDTQCVADDTAGLTYRVDKSNITVTYGGRELRDVTGVLVRRPRLVEDLILPVEKHHIAYVSSALRWHMNQLYVAFENAYWLSDYYAIQRAEAKIYQLQTAARIGFKIPETLFTSDAGSARTYVSHHDKTIVKPIARVFSGSTDGQYRMLLATQITKDQYQEVDFAGLTCCADYISASC